MLSFSVSFFSLLLQNQKIPLECGLVFTNCSVRVLCCVLVPFSPVPSEVSSVRIETITTCRSLYLLSLMPLVEIEEEEEEEMNHDRQRSRGRGGGGKDKIDTLGRLLTKILRHMATENLSMRSDGYVKVEDLLNLNLKTFANIPLRSHTIDDIKEAVRKDNKQRFNLLEENEELLIRANQGHTVTVVESESLLKQILSADEVLVCVHGTYKRNLDSILESSLVLKRMKRLHVHFSSGLPTDGKVISEGIKLYISDNKVILTEGFDEGGACQVLREDRVMAR